MLGNGLVTSEGELWRRQRGLAQPAFRPAKLEQYPVTMGDCTNGIIIDWGLETGRLELDAQDAMTWLTMAIVMLSPYLAHRWSELWPDPLRFDPDRFAPEAVKVRHPFAYFRFSLGSRICIGIQFSLLEARLVLALILHRFKIRTPQGPEIGCLAAGTLQPERAIRVELTPRTR